MGISRISSSVFFVFFFNLINYSLSTRICTPSSCNEMGPQIRFPFWLKGKQKDSCGYPGFDLSCNNQSRTILTLPTSGDFEVAKINYATQAIYINDPQFCLPKRISKFNIEGSQFKPYPGKKYKFFNCSSDWISYNNMNPDRVVPLLCLDNRNYTILAATSHLSSQDLPTSCIRMPNVSVPLEWSYAPYWSSRVLLEAIELVWDEPNCRRCELQQQYCGFSSGSGLEIGCSSPPRKGLPRSAKYGVIIGAGIPGLVCIIGLACYTCSRIKNFSTDDLNTEQSNALVNVPRTRSLTITGLDSSVIESYPKTVLGESPSIPAKPNDDGTCPICLLDYQPKETLRTIPECNHYFHVDCIDEWLKINGTCPVCRNAPAESMTPACSSVSSTFSSSISTA